MAKKVLLLYPFANHTQMVEKLSDLLATKGILLDTLCIGGYRLHQHSNISWPILFRWAVALRKLPLPRIKGILSRLVIKPLLPRVLQKYDLIDFHAYYSSYYPYMRYCQKNNIIYDITLWGSDIMRADEQNIKDMRNGFENSRYIKGTENLLALVSEKYDGDFDCKGKVVYWGNGDYDVIDSIPDYNFAERKKKLLGETGGRLIITCGYNGRPIQQHSYILEAISSLSTDIKNHLFLVFPMTYGASEEYIGKIRNQIVEIGLPYRIFDKYMSAEDVAVLRKATDLVINIQENDAFSGSLQDHLYCGNLLILGEWLRYIPLEHENVFYLRTPKEKLKETLACALVNFEKYTEMTSLNKKKLYNLTSWTAVLNKWAYLYAE